MIPEEATKTLGDYKMESTFEATPAFADALKLGIETLRLLTGLQRMVNQDGTEYPAPWSQVPEAYQKDFRSWCLDEKQQSWEGMWEQGWNNYHLEYIRYLIDIVLQGDLTPEGIEAPIV